MGLVDKNLLSLSRELIKNNEERFLKKEFTDANVRKHKKSFMKELVNTRLTPNDMVRLYEEGVTYKELGEIYGRKFQSVALSIKPLLEVDSIKKHKYNRRIWVRLMRKYNIVHLTDITGSYKRLMDMYNVDEKYAKDLYRRSGGSLLLKKDVENDLKLDKEIERLLGKGLTGIEISKVLERPQSTIYYRIKNKVNKTKDERE